MKTSGFTYLQPPGRSARLTRRFGARRDLRGRRALTWPGEIGERTERTRRNFIDLKNSK